MQARTIKEVHPARSPFTLPVWNRPYRGYQGLRNQSPENVRLIGNRPSSRDLLAITQLGKYVQIEAGYFPTGFQSYILKSSLQKPSKSPSET